MGSGRAYRTAALVLLLTPLLVFIALLMTPSSSLIPGLQWEGMAREGPAPTAFPDSLLWISYSRDRLHCLVLNRGIRIYIGKPRVSRPPILKHPRSSLQLLCLHH